MARHVLHGLLHALHHRDTIAGTGVRAPGNVQRHVGRLPYRLFTLDLGGHHRGEFDHFHQLATGIMDRVVAGLQPDLAPLAVNTPESPGHVPASIERAPERRVFSTGGFLGITEDSMVLADQLLQAVAHGGEKHRVGSLHPAVQPELDHRRGTQQGLE